MSGIGECCSEYNAYTLFNQRAEEMRKLKLEEKDPLERPDSIEDIKETPNEFESSVALQKVVEPGKGQLLDLYV